MLQASIILFQLSYPANFSKLLKLSIKDKTQDSFKSANETPLSRFSFNYTNVSSCAFLTIL